MRSIHFSQHRQVACPQKETLEISHIFYLNCPVTDRDILLVLEDVFEIQSQDQPSSPVPSKTHIEIATSAIPSQSISTIIVQSCIVLSEHRNVSSNRFVTGYPVIPQKDFVRVPLFPVPLFPSRYFVPLFRAGQFIRGALIGRSLKLPNSKFKKTGRGLFTAVK